MRRKKALLIGAATLTCAALLAAACTSKEITGTPHAGQLTVSVSTTGIPGAAFKVLVVGEGIAQPVVANPGDLIYSYASNDTLKVAVIGEHMSGPLFRFSVPDVTQASSYRILLLEVAAADNVLLSRSRFTVTAGN